MAKNSTFVATLKFVDSFSGGFSKAMRDMDKETKNFQKQMRALNELGSSISSVGTKLTVGLTLPIVGLGTKAVTSAMSYEKSLNKIMTLSRKFASNGEIDLNNPESLEQFRVSAKNMITDLSNTYGRTQTEIAESYYTLASAFNDTSKMQEALNTSLQMGIAGEVEAGSAARALATVYNAYEKTGETITGIGDKLAATVNFGFTTYEELAETLGTVVSTAAQAGVTFEDLASSMAVITSTGVSTAESTTYLKNAMAQIIKNGDREKIKDGGFLDYLIELEDKMPEIEDQMKVFKNIRARSGVTALTANVELFKEYSKQIKNADGTLQEMNDTMMGSNTNQFAVATTKLSNILQRIGEQILPTVNKYLQKFSEWLDKANITDEKVETWIRWGTALAVIGPALSIIGGGLQFISNMGSAATVLKSVATAMSGATAIGAGGSAVASGASVAGATTLGGAGLSGALATAAAPAALIAVPVMEAMAEDKAVRSDYAGTMAKLENNLATEQDPKLKRNLSNRISNYKEKYGNTTINIPKLADTINASDPKDVDSFMDKVANVFQGVLNNQ